MAAEDEDRIVRALIALGLAPVPAEQRSRSDRLRPPYRSPLSGAEPATAEAARLLEVGYGNLPAAYQRALTAAPPGRVRVGVSPDETYSPGLRSTRTGEPVILADHPYTMTHELVHELGARRGRPWGRAEEEMLARLVVGESPRGKSVDEAVGRARAIDAGLRKEFTPPPQGLMPESDRRWWQLWR